MYGKRVANIRFADLYDRADDFFMAALNNLRATVKEHAIQGIDEDKIINDLKEAFIKIRSYVELDPLYMDNRVNDGANVLFEGAQSVMLDVVKGSVPYVTSSSTLAAAAYSGGDLSPKYHRKTIGIIKAVMSRVGFGPFPSEFGSFKSEAYTMEKGPDGHSKNTKAVEDKYNVEKLIKSEDPFEVGVAMRILSKEYGTVTQRPRRVGCLDLVLLSHTVRMNGVDELVITKCDLLKEYSRTKKATMPLVTQYELEEKIIDYVPGATSAFYRVKPIISERENFSGDISAITSYDKLPKAIHDFVKEVEMASNCKVVGLGVGPKRDQYISIV
jgi:adenylosuccinate synthase